MVECLPVRHFVKDFLVLAPLSPRTEMLHRVDAMPILAVGSKNDSIGNSALCYTAPPPSKDLQMLAPAKQPT